MFISEWETVNFPGWMGEDRDAIIQGYNDSYGTGNWRIRHQLGPRTLGLGNALNLYELCYEVHFLNPQTTYLWQKLFEEARDVWTEEESDIDSGLDYGIQQAKANHYEDVSIRRIMQKYDRTFTGDRLIRIRADSHDTVGVALSSIHIPFIYPQFIEPNSGIHWWNRHRGSLEEFWHANKILQVHKKIA